MRGAENGSCIGRWIGLHRPCQRTTTEVWRSGRITAGMRSGWTTLRDSGLSSPTSAPTIREWPCQEQRGSGLTASALVSDVSALICTNEVWPPSAACECGAEQMAGHVVLQSTSSRTAWTEGSGWWDNRLAAKHLPPDLVRPSSGFQQSDQTTTT